MLVLGDLYSKIYQMYRVLDHVCLFYTSNNTLHILKRGQK